MEITLSTHHAFSVVEVSGQINSLKDSIQLKSIINTLFDDGKRNIAIKLKDVEYVDSAAINVLIYARNIADKLKGELVILEPNEYILNMLSVVGISKIFTICENLETLKR